MKQRRLTIENLNIEVLESNGKGTPIFLFHGNSSAANSYENILESAHFQNHSIIAVSFPGHGNSDVSSDPSFFYTIEMLGKIAAKVVDYYNFQHYWLVGHSLGGHAILEVLDEFPGALGLVLISAPPMSPSSLGEAFKPDPVAGCLFKGILKKNEMKHMASCLVNRQDKKIIDGMVVNIRNTDPQFRPSLGASLMLGKLRDERKIFNAARIPIALLAGAQDKFLKLDYFTTLPTARLWEEQVIVFEHGGHALHLDCPKQFEEVLVKFIVSTGSLKTTAVSPEDDVSNIPFLF
jgi:pimeloyl-ACP methyl ester carboxylesterase